MPLLTAACALLTSVLANAAEPRPNILFIMSDDHGYQAMSCYGSQVNQTPNIDRLAKEGMRFDRCFVTNSICGPCRAVILTGKYSHLNGFAQNGQTFNGGQPNVAKMLRKSGYQTAIIGKWHLKSAPPGFDYWRVLRYHWHFLRSPERTAHAQAPPSSRPRARRAPPHAPGESSLNAAIAQRHQSIVGQAEADTDGDRAAAGGNRAPVSQGDGRE